MAQKYSKNMKMEIILNILTKSENHARGIAQDLNTTHTTILRKVQELLKENVLDFKKQGKNKIVFLKKTVAAQQYIYMAEHYKTDKILRTYPGLGIAVKEILKVTSAPLIILFGSYAKELAKSDSDIDLFIETKDRALQEKVKHINQKMSLKIGVFDPNNLLIKEMIKNHTIIRGVEVFYEKIHFFS